MMRALQDAAEARADEFEAVTERMIAKFRSEDRERATAALARLKTARREKQPLLAAHKALAEEIRLGALGIITEQLRLAATRSRATVLKRPVQS